MPNVTYRYEKRARRPGTWALLGIALGLEIFAVSTTAPWYIYVIWGVCTAGLLWYLWSNPQTVLELSDTDLRTRQGDSEHNFAIASIAALSHSTVDPGKLTLHQTDGSELVLPLDHLPPLGQLGAALGDHNIPLHLD